VASSDIPSLILRLRHGNPALIGIVPVHQNYRVNYLPARDALPTPKMLAITIKFFIDHYSITSITPHMRLQGFIT
jgi:hypothetical protein